MTPVHLLIVAHAPLASALRDVALHVFPEAADALRAVDVSAQATQDEVAEAVRQARRCAHEAGAHTLALVDVAGATPANACARALAGDAGAALLSGVNVPMLWRALAYRGQGLTLAADKAREGAFSGIGRLGASD
jgi:PTS system ascorbate-specific IIA component